MTNKEIAERLDDAIEAIRELRLEFDPPKPEPGTVVWWRYPTKPEWQLGLIDTTGDRVIDESGFYHTKREMETKPARILAPDEVPVKIPPVSEWPKLFGRLHAVSIVMSYVFIEDEGTEEHIDGSEIITRAEAEAMEAER